MKTHIKLLLQEKLFFMVVATLLVVALAWIFFAPRSGVFAYLQQRSKLRNLQERTALLEKSNENLQNEVNRLHNDLVYLEEVARLEHGLLKKNEYIYDFSQQPKKGVK